MNNKLISEIVRAKEIMEHSNKKKKKTVSEKPQEKTSTVNEGAIITLTEFLNS